MAAVRPISTEPTVSPIHQQAIANLSYIRRTMEGAGQFTAIPGIGGMLMGVTALAAAALAHKQPDFARWLAVWVAEAFIAVGIGIGFAYRKARASQSSLLAQPGRKFLLGLLPSVFSATLISAALMRTGQTALMPGIWLLLYGAGIAAAGAFSVRVVPLMGLCFLVLGAVTLTVSPAAGDLFLGLGFGVTQIIFGAVIARSHGG